jgi:hypothetical protein
MSVFFLIYLYLLSHLILYVAHGTTLPWEKFFLPGHRNFFQLTARCIVLVNLKQDLINLNLKGNITYFLGTSLSFLERFYHCSRAATFWAYLILGDFNIFHRLVIYNSVFIIFGVFYAKCKRIYDARRLYLVKYYILTFSVTNPHWCNADPDPDLVKIGCVFLRFSC